MTFRQRSVFFLLLISLLEASLVKKGCGRTALHMRNSILKRPKYHVITDLDEVFKGIRRSIDDECENQSKGESLIVESSVGALSPNKRTPDIPLNEISKNAMSSFTAKRAGILPSENSPLNEFKSNTTVLLDTKRLLARRFMPSVNSLYKDNKHVSESTDSSLKRITLSDSNKETINLSNDNDKVAASRQKSADVISPKIADKDIHSDHINNNAETPDLPSNKKFLPSDSLSHIFKDVDPNDKRTSTRKPNLRTLKNSPLWSLSKLIDDVSLITGNKKTGHSSSILESSKAAEEKTKLKISFAEALEPNLHKTFDKKTVSKEKKVDNLIDRALPSSPSSSSSSSKYSLNKDSTKTGAVNLTSSEKNKNLTNEKINVTKQEPKEAPDPYAEIAAGPDRPKIPVLKTDDQSSDLAPMKMETMKNFKPLSGQHDVGGLLDSLTDKLNAGGGDVAPEQPITLPQDISNQFGDDGSLPKDPQDPSLIEKSVNPDMTPLKEDPMVQDQLPKIFSEKESAVLDQPQPVSESRMEQAAAAVGLDKEVMEKLASTDESFSKALTDKDGAISKFGSMDLLKDPSKNDGQDMSDFGGADISPGPDPYSNPGGTDQGISNDGDSTIGTEYGRRPSMNDIDNSELINGGGAGITSIPEQGMKESFGQEVGYDQMGMHGYEQNEEITGNTRTHTNRDDSYLNAALGAMGVAEGGAYMRQAIPRWDMPYEANERNSFSNSYNTHMFKKNVILRPKRDNYVSPFYDQASFDNDW